MKSLRLDALIFRHYARSALLSILTIEVLLLAMYFGINAYIGRQTERTLKSEVEAVIPNLVSQAAESINENFSLIARQARFFAAAHDDVFARPEAYPTVGEPPAFARAPNGSLHQTNLKDGSSLYIAATGLSGKREMMIAEKTARLNPLYRHIVEDTPNVVAAYLNTPGDLNRLFPFMHKVWEQYPPDLNMEDYNFFYLADAANNPSRERVWTGVYLDPAGQGWMLSCIAPVYAQDTLEGVVGLDVTVEKIVDQILHMGLPWGASGFLADADGMVLAMSKDVETLLGLRELKSHTYSAAISEEQLKPEDYNLFKLPQTDLVKGFRRLYDEDIPLLEIPTPQGPIFVAQAKIPESGWRAFVVVRQSQVFRAVNELAGLSRLIGYFAIAAMLAFYVAFFLFLRNRARRMADEIAGPVRSLTAATATIGTGSESPLIPGSGIEEIDRLTENFNSMSAELAQRSRDLVDARVRTEMRQKEAELAYTRGLYESASGYLHNIGNAITRMESCLMDFRAVQDSTKKYPEVFERLAAGGDQARGLLERFREVLLTQALPRIDSGVASLARIVDAIKQTIAHQQAGFLSASKQAPESVALGDLLAEACAQARASGSAVEESIAPGLMIRGHREPLGQGIENLLKNAAEASAGSSPAISVTACAAPGGADIVVEDSGRGIAAEDLPKVMRAGFTTKPTGHGLGLHSFAVFLSATGGSLRVESAGLNCGTKVTVEVRNA